MDTQEQYSPPPPYQPDDIIQALLETQLEKPLTIGQFEGREKEKFTIVEGDHRVDLELCNAKRLEVQEGAPCQEPGALIFRVSKDWTLESRLYRLVSEGHDDIAALPVSRGCIYPTSVL